MAAATGTPVSTLKTAGEGGAWGMALLAAFMVRKDKNITLPEFLSHVFEGRHPFVFGLLYWILSG